MTDPALLGGDPATRLPFPNWPQSSDLEFSLVRQTLDSGHWWRTSGSQVKMFENEFSKLHAARYGLAVTNGTHALELALRTLGIGPGDEVVIPSMTYVSTAMAVFMVGACPVAVDVLPDTWCFDVGAARNVFGPHTKAVIPVHFAGHVCDMNRIASLCQSYGAAIIEDAAHAHGARWAGQPAGSFGLMAGFSFQNFKLLSAGEGGILLVSDQDLYAKAALIANCGRPAGDTQYEHVTLGSNYRMSEFQAAVLNAQLTRLDKLGEQRERIAAHLDSLMQNVDGIEPQARDPHVDRHAHYMYAFCYNPGAFHGLTRELFVKALGAEGIPAFRMYPRVQDTSFYVPTLASVAHERKRMPECPVSRQLAALGVWLHHRILLADEQAVAQIPEAIEKIRKHARRIISYAAEE